MKTKKKKKNIGGQNAAGLERESRYPLKEGKDGKALTQAVFYDLEKRPCPGVERKAARCTEKKETARSDAPEERLFHGLTLKEGGPTTNLAGKGGIALGTSGKKELVAVKTEGA